MSTSKKQREIDVSFIRMRARGEGVGAAYARAWNLIADELEKAPLEGENNPPAEDPEELEDEA